MNVICSNVGDRYEGYTEKLYRALARNTKHDFNFICVTESKYPGWWSRMEHFPLKERSLLIDIDVVICGNVDFLFEYDGEFCIRRNPWGGSWCDGCLVNMTPEAGNRAYGPFLEDPKKAMKEFRSEQEMIASVMASSDTWQDLYPGKTKSYKADQLENGPDGASFVTFHGRPDPHEVDHDWVKEHWR